MNIRRIVQLLKEATSPDCVEERMREIGAEISEILDANFDLLQKILDRLRQHYDRRRENAPTLEKLDIAAVSMHQCHRFWNMLMGKNPPPRITVQLIQAREDLALA